MAAVQRRDEPRKFLDASLVPVEHALRARADAISKVQNARMDETKLVDMVQVALADEFRALADELHHW